MHLPMYSIGPDSAIDDSWNAVAKNTTFPGEGKNIRENKGQNWKEFWSIASQIQHFGYFGVYPNLHNLSQKLFSFVCLIQT